MRRARRGKVRISGPTGRSCLGEICVSTADQSFDERNGLARDALTGLPHRSCPRHTSPIERSVLQGWRSELADRVRRGVRRVRSSYFGYAAGAQCRLATSVLSAKPIECTNLRATSWDRTEGDDLTNGIGSCRYA